MKIIIAGLSAVVLFIIGVFIVNAQTGKGCDKQHGCCKKSTARNVVPAVGARPLVCKLTSKELQERKATVIAALKKEVIERKELPNGYSFRFKGDDTSIDRLVAFVKSERQCCGFFNFDLMITEEYAQLQLTGPEGAKDFVTTELGL